MQKTKKKKRCRDGVTCVVLCTLPSIYLVCVVFGTAIPTSFYIFGKCFSYLFSITDHHSTQGMVVCVEPCCFDSHKRTSAQKNVEITLVLPRSQKLDAGMTILQARPSTHCVRALTFLYFPTLCIPLVFYHIYSIITYIRISRVTYALCMSCIVPSLE